MIDNAHISDIQSSLLVEREILEECESAGDMKGVEVQKKVISILERQLEEAMKLEHDDGMDYVSLQLSQGLPVLKW